MKPRTLVIAAALALVPFLAGCSAKSEKQDANSQNAATQSTAASAETAAPAEPAAPASAARIVLRGSLPVSLATSVTQCLRNAPGHTLLSGYSVSFGAGDVLQSAGIHVPAYKGDGQYNVPVHPHTFAEDPLQVTLKQTASLPHGSTLSQGKTSTLSVTISKNGHAGIASLKNWSTLYPDNGSDNGTITWSCAS